MYCCTMPSAASPLHTARPPEIQVFLASQSPRRKALLESAGVIPVVIAPDPAMDAEAIELPLPNEAPLAYVQRVAEVKRDLARQRLSRLRLDRAPKPYDLILAADTTVALDGRILGKPVNHDEAARMLRALSGKTHQVHTAVSVCLVDASRSDTTVVSSQVRFAPLSDAWIAEYVASHEPMDKAGAYGIQGRAGAMIPEIAGSYTAIVGLPLYETLQMIRKMSQDTAKVIR